MGRDPKSSRRLLLYLPAAVLIVAALGYGVLVFLSRSMSASLLDVAEITVVDRTGAPVAGIPIVADWHEIPFHRGRSLGQSDDGGRVPLRELRGEWAMFGEFELHALLTGSPQETHRLRERTRIELPETARLVVRLVDERGAPIDLPAGSATAYLSGPGRPGSASFGRDATATFERVACASGMELEVRLHSFRPEIQPGDASPTDSSGRTIDLVVPTNTPRVVGRVVDADGDPLQDSFQLKLNCGGLVLVGPVLSTDADGRFVYLIQELSGGGTLTLTHRVHGEARGQIEVTDDPVRDLGTISFARR